MLKHFRVADRMGLKLTEIGISIPAVFRRAGLSQELFGQKCVHFSTEELFALWMAIGAVSRDPLIGLGLGEFKAKHNEGEPACCIRACWM